MAQRSMAAKALDDEDVSLELVTRGVAVAQVACNPWRNHSRAVVACRGSSNTTRAAVRDHVCFVYTSEKCDKRVKEQRKQHKRVSPRAEKAQKTSDRAKRNRVCDLIAFIRVHEKFDCLIRPAYLTLMPERRETF